MPPKQTDELDAFTQKERHAIRKVTRATTQSTHSRLLYKAIGDADETLASVGRSCGIDAAIVSRWVDKNKQRTPTTADVALMPREVARVMLRAIAASHGFIVCDAPAGDLPVHYADWVRESSEATAYEAESLRDGKISLAEARRNHAEYVDAGEAAFARAAHMSLIIEGLS